MPRRLLKEHVKTIFSYTKKSPYWDKVKKLPIVLKYIVGIFFILFGVLGMLTPSPAGSIFLIIGLALCI